MPEYIKFSYKTKELGLREPVIRIYPFVCMHYGAAQSDTKFIREQIKRCQNDPNGRAVYMGDAGECCIKSSKGDLYAQTMSPQEQHDMAVEEFEPIRDKLLFGIRGNHGHRIYKETGLDFDKNLCHRLGIPYLGVSTYANLVVNRSSYDLFFHHGSDSGTAHSAKIRKHENFAYFVDADALFTAHSHIAVDLPPAALQGCDNTDAKVYTKLRHGYICGSGYDSRSGYAEEKAYHPILPSYVIVTFSGAIVEGHARYRQSCEIIRSDGQHEVKPAGGRLAAASR